MRLVLLLLIFVSACGQKPGKPLCSWADIVPYSYDGVTSVKSELYVCSQPYGKSGRLCHTVRAVSNPALTASTCSQ